MTNEERIQIVYEATWPLGKDTDDEKAFKVSGFGCHNAEVTDLVRGIFAEIGHDVEVKGIDSSFHGYKINMAVVPLSNPNEHSYEIGETVIITKADKQKARNKKGKEGNHLPDFDSGAVRKATREEIEAFFSDLKLAAPTRNIW
jgi:hypothetical protein